jgi:hypothetical protein
MTQANDKDIFEAGQAGRFGPNPYLQSSHDWETFEFGKRLPGQEFGSRKGSTITLGTGRRYRFTYSKGVAMMNEIRS